MKKFLLSELSESEVRWSMSYLGLSWAAELGNGAIQTITGIVTRSTLIDIMIYSISPWRKPLCLVFFARFAFQSTSRSNAALPGLQPVYRHPDHKSSVDPRFSWLPYRQSYHQPHLYQVSQDISEEADVHELSDASHWPGHTLSPLHDESSSSSHG